MSHPTLPFLLVGGLSLVLLFTCARPTTSATGATAQSKVAQAEKIRSNILRADYAGSNACSGCHAEIFEEWSRSPMHRMTRPATAVAVRAPFAGETFEFKGDVAQMVTSTGKRFVSLSFSDGADARYRVTRVIGGRYREDFVGVDVTTSPSPATDPGKGEERILPVSYIYSTESYRYKGYSVLVKERPRLAIGGVWRKQCVFCHNTVPHLSTLYDDLLGSPEGGYQGSMTNDLLPPSKKWVAQPTDQAKLKDALVAELTFLDAPAPKQASISQLLSRSIATARAKFGPEHFIEMGIGCEACHGGAKEHVLDPRIRPTFEVTSAAVSEHMLSQESPSKAEWINRTCMRCHTVLFSRYGPTWEGGHRYKDPGGSTINSGEARDFALGGCSTALSCTSCHSPHAEDERSALDSLAGQAGQDLCTSCHAEFRTADAVALHSHHDPQGVGGSCINCHMPRKNMGLGYHLTRYHRISSPNDPVRVEKDRPLECAACHTDKSVKSLVDTMQTWWGKTYDDAHLKQLYGADLSVLPLPVTLNHGKPHEQVVAMAWLAATGDESHGPAIAAHLSHDYPLARYFAAQSLADLYGNWPTVDLNANQATINANSALWLREARAAHPLRHP
jgi:predicted CXXCH cytochrome family protein